MVEVEQRRRRLPVFNVALGAVETVGEQTRTDDGCWRMDFPDGQFAFAEMIGLFAGFDETGAVAFGCGQPILDDG